MLSLKLSRLEKTQSVADMKEQTPEPSPRVSETTPRMFNGFPIPAGRLEKTQSISDIKEQTPESPSIVRATSDITPRASQEQSDPTSMVKVNSDSTPRILGGIQEQVSPIAPPTKLSADSTDLTPTTNFHTSSPITARIPTSPPSNNATSIQELQGLQQTLSEMKKNIENMGKPDWNQIEDFIEQKTLDNMVSTAVWGFVANGFV